MSGEEQRPMFTASFWFMCTVLGVCGFCYMALPYFKAPVPVPKIDVKVNKEMLQAALEDSLPEVFELGAISGAKAFYIYMKKGADADKITIEQILNGAKAIRNSVKVEAKDNGKPELKPTGKNEGTPGPSKQKLQGNPVGTTKGDASR